MSRDPRADEDEWWTGEPVSLALDGVLDLHTFQPREIGDLIPTWIDACREAGVYEVRIVHGKGTGMLRRSVHALLSRNPHVESFALAPAEHGGWGATCARLARTKQL